MGVVDQLHTSAVLPADKSAGTHLQGPGAIWKSVENRMSLTPYRGSDSVMSSR